MATPEDRLAAYFDTSQPRGSFNDEQIDAIALLLARCSHATERLSERTPRTYIIFRIIGERDLVPRLLSEGFGDDWFPVTSRGLPGFLDPKVKADIVQTQHVILTKSLDLENGQHCHYNSEEQRPFTINSYIGSGSFGHVRVVESRVTYKQYALKTIRRKIAFGTKSKEIMSVFNAEMKIMKCLQHRHIVRYIGSYADRNDLGLLMSPVADCDLAAYLEKACMTPECHPTLRTFFGCLATALSYLHDKGIKHRDIKPRNILVHKASILLADFGISRDFLDTTTGPTTATQRYCSPEVANHESRNASSDVWSLGCVFLEMQSSLRARDLNWVKAYYEVHGTGSTHYHANSEATLDLLNELRSTTGDAIHARPLVWIEHMLATNRRARPTAAEVMNYVTSSDSLVSFMYSCDECCYPSSETESVGYFEEDEIDAHPPTQDSSDQHVTNAAALTTGSPPLSHDLLSRTGPETQTLVIADKIEPSERTLLSTSNAVTPAVPRLASEKVEASMNEGSRREVVTTQEECSYRIKRPLQYEEHLGGVAISGADSSESGASSPAMALDTVLLQPNPKFDHLGIENLTPSTPENIAVSSIEQALQRAGAHLGGNYRPGTNDLYKDHQDGFSKGPHKFVIALKATTSKGWIPNIVKYCTQEILRTSRTSRLLDHHTPYLLTQERFSFVREIFKTDLETSRTSLEGEMAAEEMPLLLCRYLECLAVPIIPEDALRTWPQVRAAFDPLLQDNVGTLENTLAIQDLGGCRRDLLIYFLLYMANYLYASSPCTPDHLVMLYGPYICGRNYRQPREKGILVFLIWRAGQIADEFRVADTGKLKKGRLRVNIVEKLELEKKKRAEEEEKRKRIPYVKPSLLERATFRVLDLFD